MWLRLFISTLIIAVSLSAHLRSQTDDVGVQNANSEKQLHDQFKKKVYPLLNHPDKGCVDCHCDEATSNLVLTGDSLDDFRMLLDDQYFKSKGVDTLLTRVTTEHADKRMPKDAGAWSEADIQDLKSFLDSVHKTAEATGQPADEQFPRSLLRQYNGEAFVRSENQFLTFRQLKGKIKVIFEDDWVRGDRDLFSENLAMLGGADFKTRFNESSQPSASFLTGLELLARDVSNNAYEQKKGPFCDWPTFSVRPKDGQAIGADYRSSIQQLYERVLFRPASEKEVEEAYSLLCDVFEVEASIKARDDEFGFELVVKDASTGLTQRETLMIPVSGDNLQVKQVLVDQTAGIIAADQALQQVSPKTQGRQVVANHLRLEPDSPTQRLIVHNIGTLRNVSFAGLEIRDSSGELVESIGLDSPKIDVAGAWQIVKEDGYKSYEDGNQSKGMSFISVSLSVAVAGDYQISLLWRNRERNAERVLVEMVCKEAGNELAFTSPPTIPPVGEAHFFYDCSNDSEPFAEPKASFQFSDAGAIEINNAGTFESVTAGAVELVHSNIDDRVFLIDSKDADGNENWKRFADGRFKAYNTKGAKLHDDNAKKGELSLVYRPNTVPGKDWKADDFYRLRIYYPGKKDQECQVPVIVRADNSSPIIQIAYPRLAKADASLRIDASSSYTVSHGKLDFAWRQIFGTRVQLADATSPVLEFVVPRRNVEQVAWTSLCSALLRHPDFVFTRPPSLKDNDNGDVKQRLRLVKLALDLVGRPPTQHEVADLAKGISLSELSDRYLDSQEFRDFYFHRIRLNLESQGTEIQDEPVRLWSYIAFNDRPFQEILTADYSVDNMLQKTVRPREHGKTGVLTTPGFIQGKPGLPHYNYAAQVSMLFLGFVYEVPPEIVEQREGVTALGTTDPQSVCYSCHKILTPLAFQRLNWSDEGKYRTVNEDGLPIDASDQNASEDYPFPGNGMEAFATQAVKKERFLRTIINTHVNFYFGRPMRFRDDERVLYKRLWDSAYRSNFKIRSLIREIVNSPEYLLP